MADVDLWLTNTSLYSKVKGKELLTKGETIHNLG